MRYLVGVAFLALFLTPAAAAQGGPGSGRGLLGGIVLTADQERQADSIRVRHQQLREAMRTSRRPGTMPDSAMIRMRTAMREQQRQAYRAILNPEQQEIFDRNVARIGKGNGPCRNGRSGRGRRHAGGPPQGT